MTKYTLENKPDFKNKQEVMVDLKHLGMENYGYVSGKIVGKAITNIIDYWMVDFGEARITFPSYPYDVVSVPHIAIIDVKDYVAYARYA